MGPAAGRLAHHWVRRGDKTVSTLDLLGDGVTVLAGPADCLRSRARVLRVVTHVLDESTASAPRHPARWCRRAAPRRPGLSRVLKHGNRRRHPSEMSRSGVHRAPPTRVLQHPARWTSRRRS